MDISKQLVRMKVSDLIPYEKNPRKIPQEAVDDVCESYRQCGVIDPIEIDEDNVILSGHTRRLAALEMKIEKVDCLRVTGLTDEQKRKYRILANKTGERSSWDVELLAWELEELDFEDYDFNFNIEDLEDNGDWFNNRERFDKSKEEGNEEYNSFLDKFEQKKTTDDCYTPDLIYEAVKSWAIEEYGFEESAIVRPFKPGGDYEKEKYPDGCVVLDNPPFSILANIIRFYCEKGIKFFLFAPALTLFSAHEQKVTYIGSAVSITYENGAKVSTSFITNLDNCRARTAPRLYDAVSEADREVLKEMHGEQAKYEYPKEVLTATMLGYWGKYGVDYRLAFDDCVRVSALDAQKKEGKAIYGGGFLLSQAAAAQAAAAQAAAEKTAAEKAAAEKETTTQVWELSDREREISESIGAENRNA